MVTEKCCLLSYSHIYWWGNMNKTYAWDTWSLTMSCWMAHSVVVFLLLSDSTETDWALAKTKRNVYVSVEHCHVMMMIRYLAIPNLILIHHYLTCWMHTAVRSSVSAPLSLQLDPHRCCSMSSSSHTTKWANWLCINSCILSQSACIPDFSQNFLKSHLNCAYRINNFPTW